MNIDYTLWPNTDGNLGNIKVQIPTGIGDDKWPEGDALVGNFVYKDGKLAGFVDTKALTVNDSKSTTINYDYIDIELPFAENAMSINRGTRSKYLFIKFNGEEVEEGETFDFVIIDFTTTDAETINTVRTAKRVVDNKLYDADDNLIGTWDTSKLEVGSIFDEEEMIADGLFCNLDDNGEGDERGYILSEFNSDLSSLRNGSVMFAGCINLTSFNADLSSLTSGWNMFFNCINLTSFTSDLSSLTDGSSMFFGCTNLTSFTSDLSSLTTGEDMFGNCKNLNSFTSDLSSLTDGSSMFTGCKLDAASVQHIADTINTPSSKGTIHIGIGNFPPNSQEKEAFNTIASKNWTVYVFTNGGTLGGQPWSPTSLIPIDGEEQQTPIPYWAKPVQSDEEHAQYVDENGNFFDILGGNYIYGDDLSAYGMFTCEADAAANMRLTKIEKPQMLSVKR